MPLPAALASLLLAASPSLYGGAFVPFTPPGQAATEVSAPGVELYDPVGRAQLIAERIPRNWKGSYRPFGGPRSLPAALQLERVTPLGQMVDLRGRLSLDGVSKIGRAHV